jgi:hypothetical protein
MTSHASRPGSAPRPRHAYVPDEKVIDAAVTVKQARQHTAKDGGVEIVHYHSADDKCKGHRHQGFLNGEEVRVP